MIVGIEWICFRRFGFDTDDGKAVILLNRRWKISQRGWYRGNFPPVPLWDGSFVLSAKHEGHKVSQRF